jgi:hypothetical protein
LTIKSMLASGSGAFAVLLSLLVCADSLSACADLKRAEPAGDASTIPDASAVDAGDAGGGAGDGSTIKDASAGDTSIGDAKGPGPHGSLPSGYCCTSDAECRDRHCVQIGGGGASMCLDECSEDKQCTRPGFTFICGATASPRYCRPEFAFACLDPATFTRGTRPLGACCNVTAADPDGTAGLECEGSICRRSGQGPLVCSHRCAVQGECIGDYACLVSGASNACLPGSTDYTCF